MGITASVSKEGGTSERFELNPAQLAHVAGILAYWQKNVDNVTAIDVSAMGTGKTAAAMELARSFPAVVVISPMNASAAWDRHIKMFYAVEEQAKFTYVSIETLRGSSGHVLKHKLLDRIEEIHNVQNPRTKEISSKHKTVFYPTTEFSNMVSRGVLLIMDEAHVVRNSDSLSRSAFSALTHEVLRNPGSKSKVLIVSATLYDRKEEILTMMEMAFTVHPLTQAVKASDPGPQDIFKLCKRLNGTETLRIIKENKPDSSGDALKTTLETLFVYVLIPNACFTMPTPKYKDNEGDIIHTYPFNGWYHPDDAAHKQAIEVLQKFALQEKTAWGKNNSYIAALMALEYQKAAVFARLVKTALTINPWCKVVVMLGYNDSIFRLLELLKLSDPRPTGTPVYFGNPIVLTGEIGDARRRQQYLNDFQAWDLKHRLLIGQIAVLNQSIDLDDTSGCLPRLAFISPSYFHMYAQQALGRFHRTSTKSDSVISFVYCTGESSEEIKAALETGWAASKSGKKKARAQGKAAQAPGRSAERNMAVSSATKSAVLDTISHSTLSHLVGKLETRMEPKGQAESNAFIAGLNLLKMARTHACAGSNGEKYTEEQLAILASSEKAALKPSEALHITVRLFLQAYSTRFAGGGAEALHKAIAHVLDKAFEATKETRLPSDEFGDVEAARGAIPRSPAPATLKRPREMVDLTSDVDFDLESDVDSPLPKVPPPPPEVIDLGGEDDDSDAESVVEIVPSPLGAEFESNNLEGGFDPFEGVDLTADSDDDDDGDDRRRYGLHGGAGAGDMFGYGSEEEEHGLPPQAPRPGDGISQFMATIDQEPYRSQISLRQAPSEFFREKVTRQLARNGALNDAGFLGAQRAVGEEILSRLKTDEETISALRKLLYY